MRKLAETQQGLNHLIEAGSSGFFPLFHQDWIKESFQEDNQPRISFSKAAENVERYYQQLKRHSSIERQQTALMALKQNERAEFVRSFMKMVEFRSLDRLKELH